MAYIAGVLDAEGSVGIYGNGKGTALQVLFYNTRLELLNHIKSGLEKLGYAPVGPYLDKEKGTSTSKYKIERKKDYWKLALARFAQAQNLLEALPLRHQEKVKRKEIALRVELGQNWSTVQPIVGALREAIRRERDDFVIEAQMKYDNKHSG